MNRPSSAETLEAEASASGDRDLFVKIAEILFRHDPVGINFEENFDEYTPEVRTILPRLAEAAAVHDIRRIVREEFIRWFGGLSMSVERMDAAADEIWSAFLEHRADG